MLLAHYISRIVADESRKEGARKAAMLSKSLQAYFGARWGSVDLLQMILPETISCYSEFLQSVYVPTDRYGNTVDESNLSEEEQARKKSARRLKHLTHLRALLTQAMVRGELVSCDPFVSLGDFKRQQQRRNIPDLQSEIDRLLNSKSYTSGNIAVKTYLLCVALGGVEFESLIALKPQLNGDTVSLRLGATSIDVQIDRLPHEALADLFEKQLPERPAFSEHIHLLSDINVWTLLAGECVFYDWLRLAKQIARLNDSTLFSLVRPYITGEALSEDAAKIFRNVGQKVCDFIFSLNEKEKPYWVAAFTSWPETAEMLEEKALSNPLLGSRLSENIYCPCHTRKVRWKNKAGVETTRKTVTDPNRRVLRNILFLRGNSGTLALFRKECPDVWIMRRKGEDRYVRIPADQLNKMKAILDAFGSDDVEVIIEEGAPGPKNFEEREEVLLTHPTFGGRIAVVRSVDKKRSTANARYYKVEFTLGDGKRFYLSILGEHLEKLTASN